MLRGTVTEFTRVNGREAVQVTVRAASKPGAVMAARLAAMTVVPFREQGVGEIRNLSNMRLFDQWTIMVIDRKELENVGR